jgi:hypothetical protein
MKIDSTAPQINRLIWFLSLLASPVVQDVNAQIVISEFQALNESTYMDPETLSYSDWLEIYNGNPADADLSGYTLTDNLLQPGKWKLPAGLILPAGGFLVIWADGRDSGMHTNFRLNGSGEELGLFSPEGQPVDTVVYPQQRSGYSTGRISSSGVWAVFSSPTPGAPNPDSGFAGIAGEPLFSVPGGFYSSPVSLELSAPSTGGIVRYTVNGCEPDSSSAQWQYPLDISSTAVVRAREFRDNSLPGNTVSRTYFINEPGHDLPVVSISCDPDHLWDPQTGIYVNYMEEWERPCGFELFSSSGEPEIGFNAGLRIFGGTSRQRAQKSLSIHARSRYGTDVIRYPLLPGRKLDEYASFILRNGANDWSGDWRGTLFRDALIHTIVEDRMDLDYQSYNPVAVYLNGAYWGILNIRDKHNENYCGILYGADPDSVDIIKHNQVVSGDDNLYNELMEFLENHDLYSDETYREAAGMIDTDELINYLITEIYSCNIDWPANNHRLWRPQTEGGKWRWMLFDTEFGFNGFQWAPVTTNMFKKALDPDINDYVHTELKAPWATRVFIKMTQNEGFRNRFISMYLSHIYTTYDRDRVYAIVDSLSGRLESEMPRHIARWGSEGGIYDMDVWRQNVEGMKDFARDRPPHAIAHLMETFQIREQDRVNLDLTCTEGGTLVLNGIPLDRTHFSGDFFLGIPVRIDVEPFPGYLFKAWTVTGPGGEVQEQTQSLDMIMDGDLTLEAHMVREDTSIVLRINEILTSNSTGARDDFGEAEDWIEIYNPGEEAVDLGGLYLTDTLGIPGLWEVPRGTPGITTVEGHGFMVLWADDQPSQGPLHLGFKLSREGEQVGLFRKAGDHMILIDSVSYSFMGSNVSLARVPDATGPWVLSDEPTPGAFNFRSGERTAEQGTGELRIFPNPARGEVRIELPEDFMQDARDGSRVTLYSTTGQVVLMMSYQAGETIAMDLSSCKPGLYLVRVVSGKSSLTGQIVLLLK